MKEVALYVRVSTQEQAVHGLSVDSQITALQQYAKDNGYHVKAVYNDAGISARKSYKKRPALLRMIDDCQAGKIDLILFTKLDRFFRSVGDYYECMQQIGEVPWRAIWEDYETETANGVFKVNIMLAVSQSEADRTSERTKAINDYKRTKGEYVGSQAPIGYKVVNSALVIDEETHDAVRAFFDTYLSTFVVMRAIESAESYGVHISKGRARYMMHNTTYCGDANGYSCPRYISPEEHELIEQHMAGKRSRTNKSGRVYPFSGLMKCEVCGGALVPHHKKHQGDVGKTYYYTLYQCTSNILRNGCTNGRSISQNVIERYLLRELDNIIGQAKVNAKAEAIKKGDSTSQIKALRAKLERVGVRFEDGDISLEDYRQKKRDILAKIDELELTAPKELPELPADWKEVYVQLDDAHKKGFWHRIIKTITPTADRSGFDIVFR